MKFTQGGLDLIKLWEKLELKAYVDAVGKLTIGYGHTGEDVHDDLIWTAEQAEQSLHDDLLPRIASVQHMVQNTSISNNQFSALVSLCYNIGTGNFRSSSVLAMVNRKNTDAVPVAFMYWVKGRNQQSHQLEVFPGLVNRRKAEVELWKTSDSAPDEHATPLPGPDAPAPLLKEGNQSQAVRLLQHYLIAKGHFMDGVFGPQTKTAVQEFQKLKGIGDDGIVGPETWKLLTQTT